MGYTCRFCTKFWSLTTLLRLLSEPALGLLKGYIPAPANGWLCKLLWRIMHFSALEADWRYWPDPESVEDWDKTAFTLHASTYLFQHMPFWFFKAPGTFQRTSRIVRSQFTWQTCVVYLADIIVWSTQMDKHIQDVDNLIHALQQASK